MLELSIEITPPTVEIIAIEGERMAIISKFVSRNYCPKNQYVEVFTHDYAERTKKPPLYNILPKYYRMPTPEERRFIDELKRTHYQWSELFNGKDGDFVQLLCSDGSEFPEGTVKITYTANVCADNVPTKTTESLKYDF